MKEKIVVHGPGYYLLTLSGIRNKSIFNSVFDYQYGEQIFARLERARVVGFCMSPKQIMLLAYCEKDWPDVVDQLQGMFRQHNEQCWRNSRPLISEVCQSVFVDPIKYLSKTLLQIHSHPVHQRWVIDAALYPWSSDRFYRAEKDCPDWLERSLVLNQLCKTHHHQSQRYEAAIASPMTVVFDLQNGNHTELVALSQRNLATFEKRGYRLARASTDPSIEAENLMNMSLDSHPNSLDQAADEVEILEFTTPNTSPVLQGLSVGNLPASESEANKPSDTGLVMTLEQMSTAVDDAMNLVANQFEMPIDQWHTPEHRRQYNRLMPLVVWLLSKVEVPIATLANAIGESDDRIEFWLRSIKQQHPQRLLTKILNQWQSQFKSRQTNKESAPAEQSLEQSVHKKVATQPQKNKGQSKRGKPVKSRQTASQVSKSEVAESKAVEP